jgi:uncharacterized protein with von Willebrand factor type A (vWA) domain
MSGLVGSVVDLCRGLRDRGMLVTPSHATDSVRALESVGVHSRAQVYRALRCVLCSAPEEFAIFDEMFAAIFGGLSRATRRVEEKELNAPSVSGFLPEQSGASEIEEAKSASFEETFAQKDFATFGAEELEEIERIAHKLARKMAARPSRRWKSAISGARIDLRKTARKSVQNEQLYFRERKTRKTRIVALCDVSGSMDLYSRLLLQFLYALQGSVARVESFVFATRLRHITELLRERPYSAALRNLSREASDWSGGTRIGECIAAFNEEFPRMVDRRTVVVILSDGWDTGDPVLLGDELALLRKRCRRLVWLNPLLGSEGYEPLTQGMQAALPHLSVFAPAHNLDSLRALERHLLI